LRPGRPSPQFAERASRGANRRRALIVLAVTLVGAGLALAAVVTSGREEGERSRSPYGSWAPGIAATVAAMERVPPTRAPSRVRFAARRLAERTGGDGDTAVRSLRLLRTELGFARSSLYGFRADGRAVCFLLTQHGAACPTPTTYNPAGVLWMSGGGTPAWGSRSGFTIPSNIVGLVADNVRRLAYVEDGKRTPLPIRNNTFFMDLSNPEPKGFLDVAFVSGKRARIPVSPRAKREP
jgi:hypothetical protein